MYSQVALNPSPPASASTVLGLYTYHHTHCNSLKIITCVMYRVCMCTLMGPCVYHSVHVESEGNFQESALYHVGPRSQSQLVGPGGRRPQVLPAVSAQQLVCSGGLHASCVSTPQHESGPSCDTTSQRESPKVIYVLEVTQCPSLPFQEVLLAWQC